MNKTVLLTSVRLKLKDACKRFISEIEEQEETLDEEGLRIACVIKDSIGAQFNVYLTIFDSFHKDMNKKYVGRIATRLLIMNTKRKMNSALKEFIAMYKKELGGILVELSDEELIINPLKRRHAAYVEIIDSLDKTLMK